jgi:hypothetical protein
MQMETREERVFPLVITTIFLFMAYYMLKNIEVLNLFLLFLIGSILLTIFSLLITFKTKISIHMIGVGGLTGLFIGLSFKMQVDLLFLIVISVFLSGLTGYARLKLNAHNPFQVYSGYLSGLLGMLLVFLF